MPAANSAPTNAASSSQSAAPAAQNDAASSGQTAEPLTPPTPAEGTVTADKLDQAAEWAAYAAAAHCAQEIARQVAVAASAGKRDGTARPIVLLVDHRAVLSKAATGAAAGHAAGAPGRIQTELERFRTELAAAHAQLDERLAEAGDQAAAAAQAGQESAFAQAAAAAGAGAGAFGQGGLWAMALAGAAAMAAGAPGLLAGAAAVAGALPGIAAGVGSVVSLSAAALAYLRADHTITGAAVDVSEAALRDAVCGALAAGGAVDVRLIDPADVEAAAVLAQADAAAAEAQAVKRKVEAVAYAAQIYDAEVKRLESERAALWNKRWGVTASGQEADHQSGGAGHGGAQADGAQGDSAQGAASEGVASGEGMLGRDRESAQTAADTGADAPTVELDSQILDLAIKIAAQRDALLRCTLTVKQAAALAAAFDAAAEKLSAPVSNAAASAATNASDGLSPLALAALREAVGASGADYLLHVALRSMGGETATKSKSLLARGGALALTGHSAASFLLLDRAKGNIAAADLVGAGAAMRLDAGDAQFGKWGYSQFGRMAAGA